MNELDPQVPANINFKTIMFNVNKNSQIYILMLFKNFKSILANTTYHELINCGPWAKSGLSLFT